MLGWWRRLKIRHCTMVRGSSSGSMHEAKSKTGTLQVKRASQIGSVCLITGM